MLSDIPPSTATKVRPSGTSLIEPTRYRVNAVPETIARPGSTISRGTGRPRSSLPARREHPGRELLDLDRRLVRVPGPHASTDVEDPSPELDGLRGLRQEVEAGDQPRDVWPHVEQLGAEVDVDPAELDAAQRHGPA